MPFGAMNPFPFRLGGDITAEQHSRLVADVIAEMRVAPFGIMIVAAGIPTVYFGRNGNGVATFDGGTTYVLGGNLTYSGNPSSGLAITLGTSWVDELGISQNVNIVGVDVDKIGAAAAVTGTAFSYNTIALTGPGATDAYVVTVYTDDITRTVDQYGGDLNKHNNKTESDSPYAWGWLLEMRQVRGSAYANDGLVDAENIAWARMFGFLQRVAEQESAATDPANTAGGRLRRWAQWLGLAIVSTESEATTRRKATAAKRLKLGAADYNLIAMAQAILGPAYVDIYRNVGTFDAPPYPSFWNENPPPVAATTTAFSLGAGGGTVANDQFVWTSQRFKLTVIIQIPADQTIQDVANVCDSSLTALLNNQLPSVADFVWGRLDTYGGHDGFILDQSHLDFDLL